MHTAKRAVAHADDMVARHGGQGDLLHDLVDGGGRLRPCTDRRERRGAGALEVVPAGSVTTPCTTYVAKSAPASAGTQSGRDEAPLSCGSDVCGITAHH